MVSKFKHLGAILVTTAVVLSAFMPATGTVSAQATNKNIITTKVELLPVGARVKQNFLLTNAAQFQQLQRLELKLPYKVTNISGKKDNNIIPVVTLGEALILDFTSFPVFPGHQAQISIEYTSEELVYSKGSLQRMTLPFLQLDNGAAVNQVEVTFPSEFGEVMYSNEQVQNLKDDGQITSVSFDSDQDLLVTIGNPFHVNFDLVWMSEGLAGEKRELTIPGDFTSPQLAQTQGLGSARVERGNFFVDIPLSSGGASTGQLKLQSKNSYQHYAPELNWTETEKLAEVSTQSEPDKIYADVLARYNPSRSLLMQDKDFVSVLARSEQDAFDYAATMATLLAEQGTPSNIILGFVNVPYSQNWIWSCWLNYSESDQVYTADPYLQDLTGLPMHPQVDPMRITVATIQDFEQARDFDLAFASIPEQSIVYQSSAILGIDLGQQGIDFDITVAESGFAGEEIEMMLLLANSSNVPIYIKALDISGSVPSNETWKQALVLPGSTLTLDLEGIHSPNPFIPGSFDLETSVIVGNVLEELALTSTNQIYLQVDSARLIAFAGALIAGCFFLFVIVRKLKTLYLNKIQSLTVRP